MTNKLTIHSGYEEIGKSLRETLDKIEAEGETPQLKLYITPTQVVDN